MVKFGIYLPQYGSNISQLVTTARWYEKLGFDSIWLEDHLEPWSMPPNETCPECWTALSAVASATSRIRLGSLCSSNSYRDPALLARMVITLTEVSGGRLELGLSPGWGKRELGLPEEEIEEFQSYGIPFPAAKERILALESGIRIIKDICKKTHSAGSITRKPRAHNIRPATSSLTPRVWVCGLGDMMLRCIAKHADAWSAAALSPEEFRERNRFLNHCCNEHSRDPKQIVRSIKLLFDPKNRGGSIVEQKAKKSFLWSLFYKTRLYGSKKDLIGQIRDFIDAGVEYFTLFTVPQDADPRSTASALMNALENFGSST